MKIHTPINEDHNLNEGRTLNETELSGVTGGLYYNYSSEYYLLKSQCDMVFSVASSAILKLLIALNPSYDYSDPNANFMCLIYEFAEYYFHVDGKKVSEPKCQAIMTVLTMNGYDLDVITAELDRQAANFV